MWYDIACEKERCNSTAYWNFVLWFLLFYLLVRALTKSIRSEKISKVRTLTKIMANYNKKHKVIPHRELKYRAYMSIVCDWQFILNRISWICFQFLMTEQWKHIYLTINLLLKRALTMLYPISYKCRKNEFSLYPPIWRIVQYIRVWVLCLVAKQTCFTLL